MNVEQMFLENGAFLKGHFLLSSGLHSDRYLQCALILAQPARAEELGRALAAKLPSKPDLVVSPAMGGLMIGHEVARALGVRHFFTERSEGVMVLRRGFRLSPGERVVVVEDVVTTGKSTKEVFAVLREAGAQVAAACSIVDRSEGKADLGVPYAALWTVSVPTWTPDACPQCKAGIPAVKPGSRKAAAPDAAAQTQPRKSP
jgi:orotate phosphoribosyltransferase